MDRRWESITNSGGSFSQVPSRKVGEDLVLELLKEFDEEERLCHVQVSFYKFTTHKDGTTEYNLNMIFVDGIGERRILLKFKQNKTLKKVFNVSLEEMYQ